MSLVREHYEDRESWKAARNRRGVGGSEAAAIVGLSPYMTVRDLFEIKTGLKEAPDISNDEFVSQGVRVEPALRALYQANHPTEKIEYYPFDLLYQEERPWAFSTLDGEIVREDGTKGILEIKTSTPNGKEGWKKWDEQVPSNYYCQLLWQLLSTGYDFAVLYAGLYSQDGSMTIREYEVKRKDVSGDLEWLLVEGENFWLSVKSHKLPPLTIVV